MLSKNDTNSLINGNDKVVMNDQKPPNMTLNQKTHKIKYFFLTEHIIKQLIHNDIIIITIYNFMN